MFLERYWLIILIVVLAGCTGVGAPVVADDLLPPDDLMSETCTAEQVTAWQLRFYPVIATMTGDEIRQMRDAFTALSYPRCVAVARGKALEVYENAARAADARADNDPREYEFSTLQDAALKAFWDEMNKIRLDPNTFFTSVPSQSVSCPSTTATCSELTACSQAFACYLAGNTALDSDGDGTPCENHCP